MSKDQSAKPLPARDLPLAWHAIDAAEALSALAVDRSSGLTTEEAQIRLSRFGPNTLKHRKIVHWTHLMRHQVESPVVLLLAAAALVALAFGDWKEASAIAFVLLINTALGFFTELRAVRSMDALRQLGTHSSRVRRGGEVRIIGAEELVPGDIALIEAGDIVSADLRIIESSNLAADESALTGESLPVAKTPLPVAADAPLAERPSMLFKGTAVTRGSAVTAVVATGLTTELGEISRLVEEAQAEQSPLERQLERMGSHLIGLTVVVAVAIGLTGIMTGKDIYLMVESAIALAVAAIPEGLPIVATIALARGMWRMAQQNALIERLAAVETLGATTIIMTDKTGTLTENRMEVREIWIADGHVAIERENGGFIVGGKPAPLHTIPALSEALRAAVLCNNAVIDQKGEAIGDPLEVALLWAGALAGLDRRSLEASLPRRLEVAFDTDSKMMATLHHGDGKDICFVKGAPEAVLGASTRLLAADVEQPFDDATRNAWLADTERLAAHGMRVLAIARRQEASADEPAYADLTFLGLVGLQDPPRADIPATIARCRKAGIRVIMITGDHAATAGRIARDIGLSDAPAVVEGAALKPISTMSDAELDDLRRADVFARVTPRQKLDLVTLHQKNGNIVAMTGDGVNDAPALKKADIGVAMGLRGTQVAREAAAMVLRDDAFGTIVSAIREGRIIFRNIQNFVVYLLSCNLSEVLVVGLAVLLGLPLPLLPLQILFLNLVTDVFPAFALGVSEGSSQVLNRHPRDPRKPLITPQLWLEIVGHGISITLATLGALMLTRHWLLLDDASVITASFLTLAFAQLWHVLNMRDPRSRFFSNAVTRNRFVWFALALCTGLILAAIYIDIIAEVLQLVRPDRQMWALILAMSAVPFVLGQSGKWIAAKLYVRH